MTFALTCALCLVGAAPSSVPGPMEARSPSAFGLELASPVPSAPPAVAFDLKASDVPSDWYQHDHGGTEPQKGSDHGWMTASMVVVMVGMMVVVGVVMMSRGWHATAAMAGAGSPADRALPLGAPRQFSPSGG